jgi:hypothetical protein
MTAPGDHHLRQPSEVRELPYGQLEPFHIAGQVIGRTTYRPGWRWTQHVGPTAGTELCEVDLDVISTT